MAARCLPGDATGFAGALIWKLAAGRIPGDASRGFAGQSIRKLAAGCLPGDATGFAGALTWKLAVWRLSADATGTGFQTTGRGQQAWK
ncbi:MAG: hypothetical protein ABW149_11570 [Sedimenticola sp.]